MQSSSVPQPQQLNTPPDHAAYASAVIAAIGAQAAFDFEQTPANRAAKLEAERRLRQIRDARQRAAAQNAGMS